MSSFFQYVYSICDNSIIFFLLLVAFLIVTLSSLLKKPLPPGPMGLPFIGNLNMMGQLNHRDLARLAKRHGGLFYMRMGFLHMVVVSSPEVAREVLRKQDITFSNRPATITTRYLTYDRADVAFAHYGAYWRRIRKISAMKLFGGKRDESWQSVHDEIDNLVRVIEGSIGSAVNLGGLVHSLNKKIIYRSAFGSGCDEGQEEFISLVYELSKLFGEFNWVDFMGPLLQWAYPNVVRASVVETRKAIDGFIDRIIDDHMYNKKDDLVGDLLQFYSEDENVADESDDGHFRITRDNIKGIIIDLMFGGTGTASTVVEWAMAELMKCPEAMKRAQQELTSVVGLHRRVEEADVDNLPYLQCIIKESLRLHPPFPLLLHETAKETTILGHRIPAHARVMINVWALGRDKDSWPDMDSFNPERYLKEGVPDLKGGDFEFIPFGSGRRACPALNLGLHVVKVTLSNILHCFEWELPNGMNPSELDMDELFGLTVLRASRLVVVPRQRLTCPTFTDLQRVG